MSDYPKMLYRNGDMLEEHGRDFCIVSTDTEEAEARAEGWGDYDQHPLDHDGDGRLGGSLPDTPRKRGRPRKQ